MKYDPLFSVKSLTLKVSLQVMKNCLFLKCTQQALNSILASHKIPSLNGHKKIIAQQLFSTYYVLIFYFPILQVVVIFQIKVVLSQCVCECAVMSDSLQPLGLQSSRLLCPWDFPGKSAGVGCHFLLQGIFPTQGSKPHRLLWQADSLPLSHLGSPVMSMKPRKISNIVNQDIF